MTADIRQANTHSRARAGTISGPQVIEEQPHKGDVLTGEFSVLGPTSVSTPARRSGTARLFVITPGCRS